MALSNKTAKALQDSSYGKEFIDFLKSKILSLDTLDDIDFTKPKAASIEGRGRKLARDKLVEILSPLVNVQDLDIIKDERDDFSVEVE